MSGDSFPDDLQMVQDALDDGSVDVAKDMLTDLIGVAHEQVKLDEMADSFPHSIVTPSVSSSGKGDIVAAVISLGVLGGICFFAIRAVIKEDKRIQEKAEETRKKQEAKQQKIQDDREKAQNAASRGATVLQNTDGTYWIVENERSLAVLKMYDDEAKATEMPKILHPHLEEPSFGNGDASEKTTEGA